jgi:predicted transcriptional regulator
VEEKPTPAVSIRSSVKQDAITCLECGQKLKMLKRHLNTDHGLTPIEYKARWGLSADYPLVAPAYAAKRKELALRIGLGRKPGAKVKAKPRGTKKAAAPAS